MCLSLPVACGAAGGRAAGTLSVNAESSTFALELAVGGQTVTTLGGAQAPFVYWTQDGVEHYATKLLSRKHDGATTTYTVGTDEPNRTLAVSVRPHGQQVRVRYAVGGAATVGALGFALTASPTAHFLGTGERTDWVDMRGTVVPLKAWSDCRSSSPSPFFLSTAGFGAWVSTTAVGRMAFPGAADDSSFNCSVDAPPCPVGQPLPSVRFCFKTASVTLTVARGPLRTLLTEHARAVGLPRAPWLPQFALIKWRDRVSGPADLYDDIAKLHALHIPIGWELLDNPWEQGAFTSSCYGALTFDRSVFPDPKAMIARIHAQGVRFMLWISPQIYRPACAAPDYPDGWLTGNDRIFEWDLTRPAARDAFRQKLEQLVRLGVDGFKGDRGDEVNLEPDTLAGGPGVLIHNLIPLLYDTQAAKALASVHGSHFATLFRSFVPGSSSVLPGFVGPDASHDFGGLELEIRAAQTAGVAGAPVWGSDVGGYAGGTLTANVFARWAQFAALTPIFEVGGDGGNATFWQLGPRAVDGLRAAATFHYELVPYLYALALAASHDGLPVVRPLGLEWPGDAQAWAHDLEFTVGDDLLAAPVTTAGNRSSVYLPAGTWVDVFSGVRLAGRRSVTRTNGPDDFPLYLRAGAAVPFSARTPKLWAADWRLDDLLRAGRQGWLVAPAPSTATRSIADRGATLAGRTDAHGSSTLTVSHPLGEEQLVVYPARPVCSVAAGGRRLSKTAVSGLPARPSGWAPHGRSLVVKVSGARGMLRLRLTACGA